MAWEAAMLHVGVDRITNEVRFHCRWEGCHVNRVEDLSDGEALSDALATMINHGSVMHKDGETPTPRMPHGYF